MADNVLLNAGTGGDTIAADEIAGAKYQRVKLIHGADGVNAGDVADGNPLPIDDAGGSLTVDDGGGSLTVDGTVTLGANSGVDIGDVDVTSVVPGTGATNLGKAADAVAGASDVGVAALAIRDDALATLTPADGDYVRLRTNNRGALWIKPDGDVSIDDGGNVISVDDAGGSLTVDGTVSISGTVDTELPAAVALADNLANPTTPLVGACLLGFDGATWDRLAVGGGTEAAALRVTVANDSTGVVSVDDGGGSLTVDGTVTANAGTGTFGVGGQVSHGAPDTGNPVKVGLKSIAHGSNPTAVAADDRTDWYANRHGVPWVIGGHPNVVTRTAKVADADGAQTNTALVTIAGGLKVVVTRISVVADNANTADVRCLVGFATATLGAPATGGTSGLLLEHPGIPAGGGITVGDGSGILGVGADGEDVRYTCEDPVGGSITITVSYYTIES